MTVFIPGVPVPGGSKRAFQMHRAGCPAGRRINKGPCVCNARIVVADAAGERNKRWRWIIAQHVGRYMQEHGIELLRGPLRVDMEFIVARPKGHFGAKGLRPSAPSYPTGMPDRTKLARAAEDALTKVLWYDDSLIVTGNVSKSYGPTPGLWLTVEQLAEKLETPVPVEAKDLWR